MSRVYGTGDEGRLMTPLPTSQQRQLPKIAMDMDETTKEIFASSSEEKSEEMVRLFGDDEDNDDSVGAFLTGDRVVPPAAPSSPPVSPNRATVSPNRATPTKRKPIKREWARVGITPWRRPAPKNRARPLDLGNLQTTISEHDIAKNPAADKKPHSKFIRSLSTASMEGGEGTLSNVDADFANSVRSPVRLTLVKGSNVGNRVKCIACGLVSPDIPSCVEHLKKRHGIQDTAGLKSCLSTLAPSADPPAADELSSSTFFADSPDVSPKSSLTSSPGNFCVGDKVVYVSNSNIPDILVPAALKGVIVKLHPKSNTADINYADGELSEHVPLSELRLCLSKQKQLSSLRFLQTFNSERHIADLVKKKQETANSTTWENDASRLDIPDSPPTEDSMPPTPGVSKDEREQMRRVLCQVKKFFDILLSMEATTELLDFESRIFRALRDHNKHNQPPKKVLLLREHLDDSWGLKLQCHSQLRCCGWTSAMRLSIVSISHKCKKTGKATPASVKKLKPGLLVWYVNGTACRSQNDFISRASTGLSLELQVLRLGRIAKRKDKRHVQDMFRLQTYHQALVSANAGSQYARDPKWIRKLLAFKQ